MVAFLDVDKFITRNDLKNLKRRKWPWRRTHFILSSNCYNCDSPTTNNTRIPAHFVVTGSDKVIQLLKHNFFWCQTCSVFSIYDHFPEDECNHCYY